MADPRDNALLAVYSDPRSAREAADEIRGVASTAAVRVDDPHDRVHSLRAEMREELEHSVIVPNFALIFPKESVKALALLTPIAAVLGAALAVPLAGFAFGNSSFWLRAGWAAIIGAVMGGTIVWIAGAAKAIRGPAAQSAGHIGTTVRVEGDTGPDVVAVLTAHQPLRLDVVTEDGRAVATLMTEEQLEPGGIVEHLEDQLTEDPHGDWSSAKAGNAERLQARNREMQHAANEDPSQIEHGTVVDPPQTSTETR